MKFILPNIKKFPLISLIDKIPDNDSYFEVGGWGDGQSNDDSFLSGYINEVTILTKNNSRTYEFSAENRDIDFFVLKPLSGAQYKRKFKDKKSINFFVLLELGREEQVGRFLKNSSKSLLKI